MKVVTANGKKTVKMSKQEWEEIGNKAGWMIEAKKKKKSPKEHGYFEQCEKENKGKVEDTGSYCASIIDKVKGTTDWRKGPKKKD